MRLFSPFILLFIFFIQIDVSLGSGQEDDDPIPPKIWRTTFSGNETFSSTVLENQIAAEAPTFMQRRKFWDRSDIQNLDRTELRRDVIRIEHFYQRRGFPYVQVHFEIDTLRKDWRHKVTFHIDEGEPTTITSVDYQFFGDDDIEVSLMENRHFRRVMNRHHLIEERRYERIRHNDVEGNFLSALNNAGYPFPIVIVDATVDTTNNTAHVSIEFDPGPVGYFHKFNITGNETATVEQIIRESALVEGEQYSQRAIRTAQQQIFGHHLYRFVTINLPEQPRDSLVILNIRVREFPLRTLQTQLGFGIEEIVRTSVSWQHRNPWGTTHSFRVRTKASFIEQALNLDYNFPYVFNTYSSFTVSPFAQRLDERNFLLQRAGLNLSFLYQYSQKLAGTVAYEFTINDETVKNPNASLPLDLAQLYNISAIQLTGYYGQPFADLSQKWVIRPVLEFSGFMGLGSLRYDKFSLDIRRFITLSSSTQLALKSEGGIMFGDDVNTLPSYIRFYAGGTTNVRG